MPTKDQRFLDTDDARPLRILAEYLHPLHGFERETVHDTIVFFGSARLAENGPLGHYYKEARELAHLLTRWSEGLEMLRGVLTPEPETTKPAIAKSRTPQGTTASSA